MALSGVLVAAAAEPNGAESSRSIVRECLAAVRGHLGMEVAFVGRFVHGRRHFAYVDTADEFRPIEPGEHEELEETFCARVVDGRIPPLLRDAGQVEEAADLARRRGMAIGAHLSVPLRESDGTAFGTLCCFSREPDHELRERDLTVMRVVADMITPHLRWLVRHEEDSGRTESLLRAVIDAGGPAMALQPIVDLATGRVGGYEALARFHDGPDWAPDRWFAEAHALGWGGRLEAAAVGAALTRLPRLPDGTTLSVNVSAEALCAGPDVPAVLAAAPGGRLVVELTEHQHVASSATLSARLADLRATGIRIAVDDAGSGYAGLEHILHLRPEVLKLDRVLVQGVAHHPGRRAMCEAMVQFTRRTGTKLVAEGVETEADLEVLGELGVDYAQGYLLGRPTIW